MSVKPFHLLPIMLSYSRPHGSDTEQAFCNRFIATIPGVEADGIGNYYVEVGSKPSTLFSAHTDTVDYKEGFKKILLDEYRNEFFTDDGDCLGADDTTGVWIMRLMIEKRIPGMYVFHRGEEQGCIGSAWLARNKPDWLKQFDHAIAFDRAGTRDIITSQRGSKCASDDFARDLSSRLYLTGHITGQPHKAAAGMYTDTAEYVHLIGECTNISVGYYGQHGPSETQCVKTLTELVPAVLGMSWDGITKQREPEARKSYHYGNWAGYGNTARNDDLWDDDYTYTPKAKANSNVYPTVAELWDFVIDCPEAAADLLEQFNVTVDDMEYAKYGTGEYVNEPAEPDEYPGLKLLPYNEVKHGTH